jgi:hypothetical protein
MEAWRPGDGLRAFACRSHHRVSGLALDGTTLFWSGVEAPRARYFTLETATFDTPAPVTVQGDLSALDPFAETLIAADEGLVAVSARGARSLWVVAGKRARRLRTFGRPVRDIAVSGERIAVLTVGRQLLMLSPQGRTLWRLELPSPASGLELDRERVVALTGGTLRAYDRDNGARGGSWRLSGAPRAPRNLQDMGLGAVAWTEQRCVYALRLADGRQTLVAQAELGPVHVQIEPSGLYYSERVRSTAAGGRVVFMPPEELYERFEPNVVPSSEQLERARC